LKSGFVIGAGAVAFVISSLEYAETTGIEPIAEITGYVKRSDAGHSHSTLLSGEGAVTALEKAMERAKSTETIQIVAYT